MGLFSWGRPKQTEEERRRQEEERRQQEQQKKYESAKKEVDEYFGIVPDLKVPLENGVEPSYGWLPAKDHKKPDYYGDASKYDEQVRLGLNKILTDQFGINLEADPQDTALRMVAVSQSGVSHLQSYLEKMEENSHIPECKAKYEQRKDIANDYLKGLTYLMAKGELAVVPLNDTEPRQIRYDTDRRIFTVTRPLKECSPDAVEQEYYDARERFRPNENAGRFGPRMPVKPTLDVPMPAVPVDPGEFTLKHPGPFVPTEIPVPREPVAPVDMLEFKSREDLISDRCEEIYKEQNIPKIRKPDRLQGLSWVTDINGELPVPDKIDPPDERLLTDFQKPVPAYNVTEWAQLNDELEEISQLPVKPDPDTYVPLPEIPEAPQSPQQPVYEEPQNPLPQEPQLALPNEPTLEQPVRPAAPAWYKNWFGWLVPSWGEEVRTYPQRLAEFEQADQEYTEAWNDYEAAKEHAQSEHEHQHTEWEAQVEQIKATPEYRNYQREAAAYKDYQTSLEEAKDAIRSFDLEEVNNFIKKGAKLTEEEIKAGEKDGVKLTEEEIKAGYLRGKPLTEQEIQQKAENETQETMQAEYDLKFEDYQVGVQLRAKAEAEYDNKMEECRKILEERDRLAHGNDPDYEEKKAERIQKLWDENKKVHDEYRAASRKYDDNAQRRHEIRLRMDEIEQNANEDLKNELKDYKDKLHEYTQSRIEYEAQKNLYENYQEKMKQYELNLPKFKKDKADYEKRRDEYNAKKFEYEQNQERRQEIRQQVEKELNPIIDKNQQEVNSYPARLKHYKEVELPKYEKDSFQAYLRDSDRKDQWEKEVAEYEKAKKAYEKKVEDFNKAVKEYPQKAENYKNALEEHKLKMADYEKKDAAYKQHQEEIKKEKDAKAMQEKEAILEINRKNPVKNEYWANKLQYRAGYSQWRERVGKSLMLEKLSTENTEKRVESHNRKIADYNKAKKNAPKTPSVKDMEKFRKYQENKMNEEVKKMSMNGPKPFH